MSFTTHFSLYSRRLRRFIRSCLKAGQPCRAGIEDEFIELALDLFRLQYAHNSVYRRFCDGKARAPGEIGAWRDIPAIPVAAFKDYEVTSLPPAERTAVFHSSRTTGRQPSRNFHNAETLAIYEEALWIWFRECVIRGVRTDSEHLRVIMLTPPVEQAPDSSLVHMMETVRLRLGAPRTAFLGSNQSDEGWQLDLPKTLSTLTAASRCTDRSVLLMGTAFSCVHLLDYMAKSNVRLSLPSGSRVFETGGYKGRSRSMARSELHRMVSQRLGVPAGQIFSEYGMSELASQAYDVCPAPGGERMFAFPPWARAQVISPETGHDAALGEPGLLRVFDLANVGSVLAVQTEDLAIEGAPGFTLIGRAAQAEAKGCSLLVAEGPPA